MITRTNKIFNNAEEAYDSAFSNNCRLNLDNEKIIVTDAGYSSLYSRSILKDRFELAENVIAKDDIVSCFYIRDIFNYSPPTDFLELCPIYVLEYLVAVHSDDLKNMNDVIKVLFKKKLL